jgi:hypothetical protein
MRSVFDVARGLGDVSSFFLLGRGCANGLLIVREDEPPVASNDDFDSDGLAACRWVVPKNTDGDRINDETPKASAVGNVKTAIHMIRESASGNLDATIAAGEYN